MPDEKSQGQGDGSCSINVRLTARQLYDTATNDTIHRVWRDVAWRELDMRHHTDNKIGDVYDEDGNCLSTLRGRWV